MSAPVKATAGALDEACDPDGASARSTSTAGGAGARRPRGPCRDCRRPLVEQGVSFGEIPFRLDPVPRLIGAAEWAAVERGLAQRARALAAFVADAYGDARDRRARGDARAGDRDRRPLRALDARGGDPARGLGRRARPGARRRRRAAGARGQHAHAVGHGLRGGRARRRGRAPARERPAGLRDPQRAFDLLGAALRGRGPRRRDDPSSCCSPTGRPTPPGTSTASSPGGSTSRSCSPAT